MTRPECSLIFLHIKENRFLSPRLDRHHCATTTSSSAAQTLTFPSHRCSDFSCPGSKPERVTVPVGCKNSTGRRSHNALNAQHALMSELATKSCLNVSNPIWSSSIWISFQETRISRAWAALGNLSSVTWVQGLKVLMFQDAEDSVIV